MKSTTRTIMHLIATNFYGGPEKQIVEHLLRLDRKHYRGIVASFIENRAPNEILGRATTAGIENCGVPMRGPIDLTVIPHLITLLRSEQVALLCVHGYKASVIGYIVGRITGIPVIGFSRGYTKENLKVAFYEWLERLILPQLTGVISVSEGQLKRLLDLGVQSRRSWVVHNAALNDIPMYNDTAELKQAITEELNIPKDALLVVSAGRLSPEKGHQFLLEAIGNLSRKVNDTYFIFCGDGPCRKKLEKAADILNISNCCRFVGFRQDLHNIFTIMDLMVLPSLTEGLPNVVLEAFACSKPVVASQVGGVPELVEDGINGLLVPAGRVDLLAEAILRCIKSVEMRDKMGTAGYKTVTSHFTFEAQAAKLESIYHHVLEASCL